MPLSFTWTLSRLSVPDETYQLLFAVRFTIYHPTAGLRTFQANALKVLIESCLSAFSSVSSLAPITSIILNSLQSWHINNLPSVNSNWMQLKSSTYPSIVLKWSLKWLVPNVSASIGGIFTIFFHRQPYVFSACKAIPFCQSWLLPLLNSRVKAKYNSF